MGLPKVAINTSTVEIEGNTIPVRGLTRGENAEISRLVDAKRVEDAEVYILSKGTDTPLDECKDWYANTTSGVVDTVLRAIQELTGISEGAQKSGS